MFSSLIIFLHVLLVSVGSGSQKEGTQVAELSHRFPERSLYEQLECPELNPTAFKIACNGHRILAQETLLERDSILTVIDFTKPSVEKRLFVIDIKNKKVLEKSLVAHGKNSGELYAEKFSNRPHSNQSSLGFYITAHTYIGKHGYSLRIKGIEPEINTNAWKRAIVIHGADYVSDDFVKKYGRLGRSFGCPALPYDISTEIIDLIKDSSCLFIYSDDSHYLKNSAMISSRYLAQIFP